jgi:hypothetical protein
MKMYVEEEEQLHSFLISTLFGDESSALRLDNFLHGERL